MDLISALAFFIFIILLANMCWAKRKSKVKQDYEYPKNNSIYEPAMVNRSDLVNIHNIEYGKLISAGSEGSTEFIFIVRTFNGFLDQTKSLISNLSNQTMGNSSTYSVRVVLLSTDVSSIRPLLEKTIEWSQISQFAKIKFSVVRIDDEIYAANCCQVKAMCSNHEFIKYIIAVKKVEPVEVFSHHFQFCKGNNLLHYVLTDLALQVVVKRFNNSSFISITNGDNSYESHYIATVTAPFVANKKLDYVHVTYMERGTTRIRSTYNRVDLAAVVYRTSLLKALNNSFFLSAVPTRAWPDSYYAADTLFFNRLWRAKRYVKYHVPQVVMTHW